MAPRLPSLEVATCILATALSLEACDRSSADAISTTTSPTTITPADSANSTSNDTSCLKYSGNREVLFGEWVDADGDCRNTRAEILEARSKVAVTGTCTIKTGRWLDLYTGLVFNSASKVEIDHLIPVAEAYRSGAWSWTHEQRVAFYNDTSLLVVASSAANSTKSDKDPSRWRPPDTSYSLEYIKRWARGKRRYGLTSNSSERAYLAGYLSEDSLPALMEEKTCVN